MNIDPRLNTIDDCLYRVAVRVLIIQNNRVLLVQEKTDGWWAPPGGGVEHGETIESALIREVEEELGVPAASVSIDSQIAYYNLGQVVNAVPRMNLFFKVSVPGSHLKKTDHVTAWKWFTKAEFFHTNLYDKERLASVIFSEQQSMNFALVIPKIKNSNKLVFQRRDSKAPTDTNLLGLFGGSIESEETPLDGAVREFAEETSFRLGPNEFTFITETNMPTAKGMAKVHLYTVEIDDAPFDVYEGSGYESYTKAEFLQRHDISPGAAHILQNMSV